jgi:nucleoside phosphorylase
MRVKKGISADVIVDNIAYKDHMRSNFDATPTDMESIVVALVCYQHKLPFLVIRALSNLAGGGSALTNEASVLGVLASQNAFKVLVKFISLL